MLPGINRIDTWIDIRKLFRAIAVLSPFALLAATTGDHLWMRSGMVTYACFTAAERAELTPSGVILLGAVTILGFAIFYFSLLLPPLFIAICAISGMATVGLTAFGEKLRWIGISVFISALYIACETAEQTPPAQILTRGLQTLPYIAAAVLPVLLLSIFDSWRNPKALDHRRLRTVLCLHRGCDMGDRVFYGEAMLATGLAVAVAAALVEWEGFSNGQWIIWSAASVLVTGAPSAAHLKFRDRSIGAMIGGPVGTWLGYTMPHTNATYGIAIAIGLISFLSIRKYMIGYTVMSAAVACAIVVANLSPEIAAQRSINVVLGGVIGVLFLLIVHRIHSWRGRR